MKRGIVVALAHCLIVLGMAGKYAFDRERLPRVWVRTAPYDPNMPLRGRYVQLRMLLEQLTDQGPIRFSIRDGKLVASNAQAASQPVYYFIPEHAKDPSRREKGEELWVEVSVPAEGNPRPIRLGIKKDGVLKPLE